MTIHYKAQERCKLVCKQTNVLFQGTFETPTGEEFIVFANKKTKRQYHLEAYRFNEHNIKSLLTK